MAYRIERIIPGDFCDYLMHLWEGTDLPSFIGATSKAYLFDDKEVADAVAQRLAAKCSQTMETPHLKSQPITYEVVEVSKHAWGQFAVYSCGITPEQCGASQLACMIVNETFLGLDGFAAMRKQMAGTDYTAEHFGAELARIVDRNLTAHISFANDVIEIMGADEWDSDTTQNIAERAEMHGIKFSQTPEVNTKGGYQGAGHYDHHQD